MINLLRKKEFIFLILVLLFGGFLRFYAISDQMNMISDQGWFFISAKDLLVNGNIPLVGITSSHTWLHQGPIWTYILAGILWIGNFNPVHAGYFSVLLDLLTILVIYKVCKDLFSKETAIVSGVLYATSPLIIIYSRMPYHTSPIPLLSILFILAFFRFVKGKTIYFPVAIFICALLYNFELATVLFPIILFMFLFYGIWKKKKWAKIFNKRTIFLSVAALTPMIPILIYDFKNGFFQTIKFAGWLFFQALGSVGIKIIPQDPHPSWESFITFFLYEFRRIFFYRSEDVSSLILVTVIVLNILLFYKLYKTKGLKINYVIFYFTSFVLFGGFISQRESSGAYLTMLFPYFVILVSVSLLALKKYQRKVGYLIIIVVSVLNSYFLLKEYRSTEVGGLKKLIQASEFIVNDSGGERFQLERKNFKSNIDINHYRYLVWWKGGKLDANSRIEYGIYNATEWKPENYIYEDGAIYITKTEKKTIVLIK